MTWGEARRGLWLPRSFTCLIALIPRHDLLPASRVRRLRLREGKSFLQDHSARIWQSGSEAQWPEWPRNRGPSGKQKHRAPHQPWSEAGLVKCRAQGWDGFYRSFLKNIFVFIYLASPSLSCSTQDLVPRPGIEPGPPAWGTQSLSH